MKVSNLWVKEWFTPDELHSHRIARYILRKQTRYQRAVLADSCSFGRCLILDGEMQSAALDEFIYHEALVHPALIGQQNPENVLILGGGEGATLREVLKHKSVKTATMVDIDGEVVEFCRKHLKQWHQGAMSDARVRIVIDDAKKFVETTNKLFDAIISDLPTAIEAGPAYSLYTLEFYKTLATKLAKNGVLALQAGSGNILQISFHTALYSTLKKVFKIVRPYYAYVPSFDVPWAYLLCSNSYDPAGYGSGAINKRLSRNVSAKLKFYDGITHTGLFNIPKHMRTMLDKETRIITEKAPIFFYK